METPAMRSGHGGVRGAFDRFAGKATRAVGSAYTFVVALLLVLAWAMSGSLFAYSQNWQLVVNTGTTIVTFLVVFLIQHSQNKDSLAVHLKLNELIASQREASNRLVAVEDLDEAELQQVAAFYRRIAHLAEKSRGVKESHSLDEAEAAHARKSRAG